MGMKRRKSGESYLPNARKRPRTTSAKKIHHRNSPHYKSRG